jgi:hypothetical protein
MTLWQDFLTNEGKIIHKSVHYFPIYERHFAPWRNRSLTFLEIGVSAGGSLQMWQRYFGPLCKVVGIDIMPQCKQHEAPGIFVRIGDQSDPAFLASLIGEFGVPDVVLDDGSHRMAHIQQTFDYLYPRMGKNAVYMVEDLHTCYWPDWGGGINEPGAFTNICKGLIDRLNADYSGGAIESNWFTKQTFGMAFYDSVAVFEKGDVFWKDSPLIGEGKTTFPRAAKPTWRWRSKLAKVPVLWRWAR